MASSDERAVGGEVPARNQAQQAPQDRADQGRVNTQAIQHAAIEAMKQWQKERQAGGPVPTEGRPVVSPGNAPLATVGVRSGRVRGFGHAASSPTGTEFQSPQPAFIWAQEVVSTPSRKVKREETKGFAPTPMHTPGSYCGSDGFCYTIDIYYHEGSATVGSLDGHDLVAYSILGYTAFGHIGIPHVEVKCLFIHPDCVCVANLVHPKIDLHYPDWDVLAKDPEFAYLGEGLDPHLKDAAREWRRRGAPDSPRRWAFLPQKDQVILHEWLMLYANLSILQRLHSEFRKPRVITKPLTQCKDAWSPEKISEEISVVAYGDVRDYVMGKMFTGVFDKAGRVVARTSEAEKSIKAWVNGWFDTYFSKPLGLMMWAPPTEHQLEILAKEGLIK